VPHQFAAMLLVKWIEGDFATATLRQVSGLAVTRCDPENTIDYTRSGKIA
jgi:hypothetical protein